jgi:hypothetical protein
MAARHFPTIAQEVGVDTARIRTTVLLQDCREQP